MVSNSMLLKRLCLLFGFILATTSTVYGGNSLFGLPIESPKANIHIEAVLIDLKTNEEWILTEDLAGISELHGKIRVTHENKSIDIFYHEKYDDKRLIINDLECRRMDDQPSYWSRPLPDVRNQVKKMLIHLGPSVIYRLKSLKWKDSIEAGINGMKQRRANLDKTLSITASYKSNNTNDIDKLARLSFSDISGSSFGNKTSASLVLEIVSQTIVNENLDDRVEPTPGIGCPNYFHGDLSFPELKTRQLHFAATEQITNSNGTRKVDLEVYVDLDKKVTRIDMDQNFTINDFNLAVSYVFNHGKCAITAFSDSIEGLIGGELNINELLWTNGQYKYVGKTVYEPRAQGVFDTWESIEYGRNIDGVKFDKVVTTQYMTKLSGPNDNKTSNNYIPVAVVRVGYNKDSMGKYQVHESRRRDILEFQRAITPSQYENLFQITDCFDPQERKYLTFDIRSENHDYSCNFVTQRAEENIYEFKESFKHLLTKNISPLRISSMNFNFQSDKISSTVEFLEKPALEKSFKKQDIQLRVGSKMFTQMFDAIKTKSLNECLKTQVANSFFRKILHCPSADGLCAQLDDPLNQTQDNGDPLTECSLYTFPLTIKVRLAKEYGLSHLHRELLGTKNMIFSMHCGNCSIAEKSLKYRMINVYDYNYFGDSSKEPRFTEIQKLHKLDPKVKSVQIVKGPIRDFADCYNSCASSLDGSCSTFTHCISGVSHECYTTVEPFTGNSTVFHPNCTTYARDYLIEYQKTPAKEFLDSNQREHLYSVSVADCATLCHRSNSCLTFQYCGNNVCSFSGPYTSKIIKPNSNCDIYVPKKSHEFMLTGESLVNQVISTVSGLNLEQCAALCFDWKYGNESCTSFNYCPTGRSESTCALTKYSVGDSTVETTASNYCFNFELIKSRTRKHKGHAFLRNEELGNAGTSISLAFLVVGLALGVAITSMYHTFHNRHKYRVTSADQESND